MDNQINLADVNILLKCLFVLCIPVGIFLLVMSIKLLLYVFNAKLLTEIHYTESAKTLTITKSGRYAIWVKAPAYKYNHLDKITINISDYRQESLNLRSVFPRAEKVNGSNSMAKIFTFFANEGTYELKIVKGSSVNTLEKIMLYLTDRKSTRLKKT